jgi:RNA polymerase sigma-70 factor (ECF subfamily)
MSDSPPDAPLVAQAVQLAREGDREGLHFLYVRFAPDVLRCVAHIVHDDDEAAEITRSVFVGLVTKIDGHDSKGLPFATWILDLARNAAIEESGRGEMPHQRGRTPARLEEGVQIPPPA